MQKNRAPKVSVCVLVYNHQKYIRQCLQSIVDQKTCFDFEVLVADDCSTDMSREIVLEFAANYPKIVKPIFNKENVGGFKNFVMVHNAAAGEYVSHCDGDDFYFSNKLQAQADFLDENPGCTVTWHRVNYFNEYGWNFSGKDYDYSMFKNGIVTLKNCLKLGAVATHSSMMYRRSARKTLSPTFEVIDCFYYWEYLSSGWGVILDDVLGSYRVNVENSMTVSSSSKIKKLYAQYAMYFYNYHRENRKEIFMFCITNFLIDLKNRRKSALSFFLVALRTFCFVSPFEFISHLRDVKKLITPKPPR